MSQKGRLDCGRRCGEMWGGAAMSVLVRFDAELRLVDDEVPETLDYASIQQAVQDSIGFTGVIVIDVTEYEEQSSQARTGDRSDG